MSAGPGIGYIINLFVWGAVCIAIGKAWDILGSTMNKLNAMGLTTQDSMNVFFILTMAFYGSGIMFLIAGGYNVIVENKKDNSRGT
jgi:hypothetical protein